MKNMNFLFHNVIKVAIVLVFILFFVFVVSGHDFYTVVMQFQKCKLHHMFAAHDALFASHGTCCYHSIHFSFVENVL